MKIGYDAKRAFHNKTGLGNYSRSLLDSMTAYHPENQYYLFNPKFSELYLPKGLNLNIVQPKNLFNKSFQSFWRTFSINKVVEKLELDIFHGLSHELPYGKKNTKTKWVLTVHDLIIFRFPQFFKTIDRKIYARKLSYSCKKADAIIAISEQTKNDLISYLKIPEHKITVVYQTCNQIFKEIVPENIKLEIRKKYSLPENFLLQVGTIEKRKNLLLTVRALSLLNSTYKLVVIGKKTDYFQEVKLEIDRLQLADRVLFFHDLDFNELPAIYQLADTFIYPSHYEGFGIPIIEALYCGTPVIAAESSCLQEAGGPDSYYIDPNSPIELVDAIMTLQQEDKKKQAIEGGSTYIKRFEEKKISDAIMKVYKSILHE
jgi:glycosyltransferase involved in cell wall biosynthesis